MKNLNVSSFVVGILFSTAIFTIFAFTQNRETTQKQDQNSGTMAVVTPAQAAQYRANYEANFPQGLRGLNISKQQLEVLNQTAAALGDGMRNVSGFRLYYGSMTNEPASPIVSIAYSINNTLQQNPPGQALQMAEGFPRSYAQQCPPFCD